MLIPFAGLFFFFFKPWRPWISNLNSQVFGSLILLWLSCPSHGCSRFPLLRKGLSSSCWCKRHIHMTCSQRGIAWAITVRSLSHSPREVVAFHRNLYKEGIPTIYNCYGKSRFLTQFIYFKPTPLKGKKLWPCKWSIA